MINSVQDALAEEFFVFSSGLAGEILQKFVNYGVRCSIYGDYSRYTINPLKDLSGRATAAAPKWSLWTYWKMQ